MPYFYIDPFEKYNIDEIFKYPNKSKCTKTNSCLSINNKYNLKKGAWFIFTSWPVFFE